MLGRRYLPREAVKIMSGFSEEVAIAVTQPLWPDNEPRKRSDSVIPGESRGLSLDTISTLR